MLSQPPQLSSTTQMILFRTAICLPKTARNQGWMGAICDIPYHLGSGGCVCPFGASLFTYALMILASLPRDSFGSELNRKSL